MEHTVSLMHSQMFALCKISEEGLGDLEHEVD